MSTTDRPSAVSVLQLINNLQARHGDALFVAVGIVEQRIKLDVSDTTSVAGKLLDILELVPSPILRDILNELNGAIVTIPSKGAMNVAQLKAQLDQSVSELELSIRSANVLTKANIRYVGELVQIQESQFLKFSGAGRISLKEIKELLAGMHLSLGMGVMRWKPPTTQSTT